MTTILRESEKYQLEGDMMGVFCVIRKSDQLQSF